MSWFYLIVAGCFEALWLVFLDKSASFSKHYYVILAVASMAISLALFSISLKQVSTTVAYLVWLGSGVCAIALVNHFALGVVLSVKQWVFLGVILVGIVGLKSTS
ncbi:DMT family transporter [Pseudoalteromonas sp. S16_S37]|uniref:DMT family transporter n=1 Tax=Pseudoalteromonas sp. S16_S37 TaxID=2720228 RepID=UPI0016804040|nr:SMR family transporter [Pseudoalteromonas sp. S16_S37]MBD1584781.1 hypothetical protein [Pseudoalteromonas sp. S16_S37]